MAPEHDAHRGYLDAAVARTRLPISVRASKDIHGYYIAIQDARIRTVPLAHIVSLWNAGWPHLTGDPRNATRAYLDLVSALLSAGPSATPPGSAQLAAGAV